MKKKVVGRTAAIALGITCIILVVGLVGAVANYTSIISGKDSTIASKDSQIGSLNSQVSSLTSQVDDLTDTVNLAKSTIWVNDETVSQTAGGFGISYTYWTVSASYAGYILFNVQSSTTSNTYVRVVYSAYGVNYDTNINVGTGGTAVFPVLPSSNIQVEVGNGNLINGATETLTITYHY